MEIRERNFKDGRHGSALAVRVMPRSSKNEIVEVMKDGRIKIRLTAPPVDGKANLALIRFLAGVLGIPESNIEIVAGGQGRDKIVSILGMDSQTAEEKILKQIAG
jgi:hypothetical protein